jgi:hypothetical protein
MDSDTLLASKLVVYSAEIVSEDSELLYNVVD